MSEETFKRIESTDVTSALVCAMERAEETEHILILCDGKNEKDFFIIDGTMTIERVNWLIDTFKKWLMDRGA